MASGLLKVEYFLIGWLTRLSVPVCALFGALCPENLNDPYGCYKIIEERYSSRVQAVEACLGQGAFLANIETGEEMQRLQSLFSSRYKKTDGTLQHSFWLSLYYNPINNQWCWGNGANLSANDPMWASGQPSFDEQPRVGYLWSGNNGIHDVTDGDTWLKNTLPICETEQIPIMHQWTARNIGDKVTGLDDADPNTCWTIYYDELQKQAVTLLGRTSPFRVLEVNITMQNIRTTHNQCIGGNSGQTMNKMHVFTQSAAAHMAGGNCKPFCEGIQSCDVINVAALTNVERHTLHCSCHGLHLCRDLAMMLSESAVVDHTIPIEICHINTRSLNAK